MPHCLSAMAAVGLLLPHTPGSPVAQSLLCITMPILPACRSEKVEKADEAYFDSYGYFDIHRTMLGDKVCCSDLSSGHWGPWLFDDL